MRAGLQGCDLGPGRFAAHDQGDLEATRFTELLEHFGDLFREFAGWGQDQAQHAGALGVDHRHHGRAEGQGLAGAGFRLGDDVAALQHRLDGQGLDGRRLDDTHPSDGGLHELVEGQFAKALDLRRVLRRVQGLDGG